MDDDQRKARAQTRIPIHWAPRQGLLSSKVTQLPPASQLPSSIRRGTLLDRMDPLAQEKAIVQDLLYVLIGSEGCYIRFHEEFDSEDDMACMKGPSFRVASGLDVGLRELTNQLLQMGKYYHSISAFCDIYGKNYYGSINHALCYSIRNILQSYIEIVTECEQDFHSPGGLTLHSLHSKLVTSNSSLHTVHKLIEYILYTEAQLNQTAAEAQEDSYVDEDDMDVKYDTCKGGLILCLISDKMESNAGDGRASSTLNTLLQDASRPYMAMLTKWIQEGKVYDPHGEFMIIQNTSISKDNLEFDYSDVYWDRQYTIRDRFIPRQLHPMRNRILLIGKYLNILNECNTLIERYGGEIPLTFDSELPNYINSCYLLASKSLLQRLSLDDELKQRLRSIKYYFFLDRGDYLVHFLDIAQQELRKPAKSVSSAKLQSLFDIALRQPGTVAISEPYKEDVVVQMNDSSLTDWLMNIVQETGVDNMKQSREQVEGNGSDEVVEKTITGVFALELDYKVPFPLSLVISRKTILRYQLLFRHFVGMHYLDQLIGQMWIEQLKGPAWTAVSTQRVEDWKRRTFALRAKISLFLNEVLYFCAIDVVESRFQAFENAIPNVASVDDLMNDHVVFLDVCLKECMLTNTDLLKSQSKLLSTCTSFASYVPQFTKALSVFNSDGIDETRMIKMEQLIKHYEDGFSHYLRKLLDCLSYCAATETSKLLVIYHRLSPIANR